MVAKYIVLSCHQHFFLTFYLFILGECEQGRSTERRREKESKAGSVLSAQSQSRSQTHKPWIMTRQEIKSQKLNQPSHQSAPSIITIKWRIISGSILFKQANGCAWISLETMEFYSISKVCYFFPWRKSTYLWIFQPISRHLFFYPGGVSLCCISIFLKSTHLFKNQGTLNWTTYRKKIK